MILKSISGSRGGAGGIRRHNIENHTYVVQGGGSHGLETA